MADADKEREQRQLERIRSFVPWMAVGLSLFAFVAIKMAGHSVEKSLLVAAIMFAFVLGTFKLREGFGVKGFIIILCVLSAIGVLGQRWGWF